VLFGSSLKPGFIGFLLSTLVLITGWLISTKFQKFQTPLWRVLWFWNMFLGITFYYLWLITMPVYNTLIPYLGNLIEKLQVDNIWFAVAVGDIYTLFITIIFKPSVVTGVILMWLGGQYSNTQRILKPLFMNLNIRIRSYKNGLRKVILNNGLMLYWVHSETKELIIQPGNILNY
jgi:hypothetical protein